MISLLFLSSLNLKVLQYTDGKRKKNRTSIKTSINYTFPLIELNSSSDIDMEIVRKKKKKICILQN